VTEAWPILGRKLRLALLGGGPGSFIGPIHRAAARLDDRYEIVAGVLSPDPARNAEGAAALGIRAYPSLEALVDGEKKLDAVAIMTPNHRHHAECLEAIAAGRPQLADRPALMVWGMRDWVFTPAFLQRWLRIFPHADVHRLHDAAHYVVEDAGERIVGWMDAFLERDVATLR